MAWTARSKLKRRALSRRPASLTFATLLSTLGAVGASSVTHQQTTVIPDEVTCDECSITIEQVAVLRPSEEDGDFLCSEIVQIAGDRDRFFVVDARCLDPKVLVFDRTGAQIDSFGGRGQGPGELSRVRLVFADRAGSVYVYEPGKVNEFSEAGQFVQSAALPGSPPTGIALMADGSRVVASLVSTPELVGYPLHVVDSSWTITHSFGETNAPMYSSATERTHLRVLSPSLTSPELIWSGRMYAYEIEAWDPSAGALIRRFVRDAPWFEQAAQARGYQGARQRQLREDNAGLLWTIVNLLTDDLETNLRAKNPIGDYYDTVVEVLDLESGQVVARTRHDAFLFSWADEFTFSTRLDEELNIIVDVWRATLHGLPE